VPEHYIISFTRGTLLHCPGGKQRIPFHTIAIVSMHPICLLTFPATALSWSMLQIARWSMLIPCVLLWRDTDETMNQEGNRKKE
jgi:hypothetical protein